MIKVAKPFVKWAGGKGQLVDKLKSLYPTELLNGEIAVYIEPFVGGGAILFDVLQRFDVKKAIIIDLNKELINCLSEDMTYRVNQAMEEVFKQYLK